MHFYKFLQRTPIKLKKVQACVAGLERHIEDSEVAALHDSIEHLREHHGKKVSAAILATEINQLVQTLELHVTSREYVLSLLANTIGDHSAMRLTDQLEHFDTIRNDTIEKGYIGAGDIGILRERFRIGFLTLTLIPNAPRDVLECAEFDFRLQALIAETIVDFGQIEQYIKDESVQITYEHLCDDEDEDDTNWNSEEEEDNGITETIPAEAFLEHELEAMKIYTSNSVYTVPLQEFAERYNSLDERLQSDTNTIVEIVVGEVTWNVLQQIQNNTHMYTELQRIVLLQSVDPDTFVKEEQLEDMMTDYIRSGVENFFQDSLEPPSEE